MPNPRRGDHYGGHGNHDGPTGYDGRPGYGGPAGYDSGYNTGQVYAGAGYAGGRGGDGNVGYRGPRPAPDWGRRIKVGFVTLLVVLLVWSVGTYFWADSKLRREVDLSTVVDRPEKGEGTTYLIVGSDSREGLTAEERKELHTGSAAGKRTDSMILLHDGPQGVVMISLPRDSWVTIPEFKGSESGKMFPSRGANKLNASYSMDGATLLVRTVEYNTGLRIDHYAEIGFGGFAKIVDAVGGVEMDIPRDIKDKNSGADFEKGRQTLNGAEALAFVRNRYEAGSDLERTKNQQKFLAALADQTATPSTVLNPFRLYPTMSAGLDTLIVDKDMGLFDLASMFWAMKDVTGGEGVSMNMPIAGSAPQGSLKWDMAKVKTLVEQIKNGEKVTVKGD
ncbi:LytR family transcriptional regulator [Streptomyces sp. TRM43335]|uniref:LytR family transcriptional regulator n=2 Tax=Streptomyces taklimakanensis TaxID=2569853 RepID=A0A6G2BAK8_9ACTN|nr:LCP family protein [Streptomyces taklimakanensis]MTE19315.1 LytR family transcriptional regulator [Streptomyces taklimakanensis]